MVQVLKDNQQFILILFFWLITGMYAGPLVFGIVPLFVLVMFKKGFYSEILIGFWFIIILSDSYENRLEFAKNLKSFYLIILSLILFTNRHVFKPFSKFYYAFIPYFIISVISIILFSPIITTSLQKFISYFLLFLITPNYLFLAYKKDGDEFYRKIFYFVIFILVSGVIIKYINQDVAFIKGGRYRGIFGNPNGIGLFCFSIFTFFLIIIDLRKNLFSRQEKLLFFALVFVSLIWSGSRSNTVAILIFFSSIYIFNIHFLVGLFFVIVSFIAYEVIGNNYIIIIQTLGLEEYFRLETLDEGGGRYVAWAFAWEKIQDNFFMGKGFGWDDKLMKDNYRYLSVLGHEGNVHNSYLTFWLNSGLIGLISYMIALFSKFIKASFKSNLAFPLLFAVLFTANFESWLIASLNPYTIVLVMSLTLLNNQEFYSGESIIEDQNNEISVNNTVIQ